MGKLESSPSKPKNSMIEFHAEKVVRWPSGRRIDRSLNELIDALKKILKSRPYLIITKNNILLVFLESFKVRLPHRDQR